MDSSGNVGVREHGFEKYGAEGLLASSVGLGWSGLSAELLTHGRGVIEYQGAESGAEIHVAISSSNSFVTRSTGGVVDRAIAERGMIWLSPPGPKECLFVISAPVPQVLHIYLSSQHFSADSLGIGADAAAAHTSLRYERSFGAELASCHDVSIVARVVPR